MESAAPVSGAGRPGQGNPDPAPDGTDWWVGVV